MGLFARWNDSRYVAQCSALVLFHLLLLCICACRCVWQCNETRVPAPSHYCCHSWTVTASSGASSREYWIWCVNVHKNKTGHVVVTRFLNEPTFIQAVLHGTNVIDASAVCGSQGQKLNDRNAWPENRIVIAENELICGLINLLNGTDFSTAHVSHPRGHISFCVSNVSSKTSYTASLRAIPSHQSKTLFCIKALFFDI